MSDASQERFARLRVWRGDDRQAGRFEEYRVPYQDGASILDALLWIRSQVEPGLAVRHSCINGNVCKECLVQVDGRTDYACTARLNVADVITVEPLPGKRLIRDLVTDIVPPSERLAAQAAAARGER